MNDTHFVRPPHTPIPVILIACFELLRAILIGWAALSPVHGHTMDPVPFSVMQVLTLDARFFVPEHSRFARDASAPEPLDEERTDAAENGLASLPVIGLCLYLGFGLILRNLNACAVAAFTSLLTVLFWLRGLLFSWAFVTVKQDYFSSTQAKSNIMLALLLNLLIFCYLAYDEHVARAFLPQRHNSHGF